MKNTNLDFPLPGQLDQTVAGQQALASEQQEALRKAAFTTSWTPAYRPYCVQTQVKCNSPRMVSTEYGFRCPTCGNKIGHHGTRLQESPLNRSKHDSQV
jgi:hypothetical protein